MRRRSVGDDVHLISFRQPTGKNRRADGHAGRSEQDIREEHAALGTDMTCRNRVSGRPKSHGNIHVAWKFLVVVMSPGSQARVVWSGDQGMTDAILNERFTKKNERPAVLQLRGARVSMVRPDEHNHALGHIDA